MKRRQVLVVALSTCLIVLGTKFFLFSGPAPLHLYNLDGPIEKVVVQTQCPPSPLPVLSLPFHQAIISNMTVQGPAEHRVPHCRPRTPLFIGFTENEPLLAQTILSYIASGWPGPDIIVVDNTGAFQVDSESKNSLNYDMFRQQYGVNVLQSPTQLSIAQLQNFYIHAAQLQGWQYFFWSHMDIVVLNGQYPMRSLYQMVVSSLEDITAAGSTNRWAFGWYRYDWLSLVNVEAAKRIGPWTMEIPYYNSDCDYYTRARLHSFRIVDFEVGHIMDVDSILPDAHRQLMNGSHDIYEKLLEMESKKELKRTRADYWQDRNNWKKIVITKAGREVYRKKWGTSKCNPRIIPV